MMVRDRLVAALYKHGLVTREIHHLQLTDVVRDPAADYLEACERLPRGRHSTHSIPMDSELRFLLEDYLNAPHQGRPFADYRPDIGQHLFPSARTGSGLSRRALRKMRRQGNATTTPAPASPDHEQQQ